MNTKRGRLLTVTQTARLLGEQPQTVRYYIRTAKTLRALQPEGRPGKVSRSRYKIRERDVLTFAANRGDTEEELAELQHAIDAILGKEASA